MPENTTFAPPGAPLIDDSDFPILRYRIPEPEIWKDTDRDRLLPELEALLAREERFVLITIGLHDREPEEVRKGRAVWFKAHRGHFAEHCLALIHVCTDQDEEAKLRNAHQNLADALGTQVCLARDEADAERQAQSQIETAEIREEVAGLLQRFQESLLARDFATLEGLMTEDFAFIEADGTELDKASLLARERRGASGQPATEIEHRLLAVAVQGEAAEARVELRFRTVIGEDASQVVFEGRGEEQLLLQRIAEVWRFRRVTVEKQELTRNGEPAGAEVIAEMHRGA